MGRLRKVSHQDVPLVSSLESADSVGEAFVPNDFAEDGSFPVSMVFIYFLLLFILVFLTFIFLGCLIFLLVFSAGIIW